MRVETVEWDSLTLTVRHKPIPEGQAAGVKDTVVIRTDSAGMSVDSLLFRQDSVKALISSGREGIPMPYRLRSDDGVTAVLLFCFFLSAYVFSQGKKFLLQQVKDFTHVKERASIFTASTAAEFRYRAFLLLQTCILSGVCFFDYFHDFASGVVKESSSFLVLGIYISVLVVYLILKWELYKFIGWVFFDKSKTKLWLEAYSVILYYLGFALFPLVLLTVYVDLSSSIWIVCGLSLLIIAKILMFYKWLKLFFGNLYGVLYLIMYFCALEIVPCFILYQGLVQINNLLLTKL